eukprot:598066-Pyramimonas_sp.AAC.1
MNTFSNIDKCMIEEITACDAVLFQETRLCAARSPDAESDLGKRGWRAYAAPAVPSLAGGLATGGL